MEVWKLFTSPKKATNINTLSLHRFPNGASVVMVKQPRNFWTFNDKLGFFFGLNCKTILVILEKTVKILILKQTQTLFFALCFIKVRITAFQNG